ncbi:MAG: ABC transporter permease [Prevotella sp.]|nr:ABC transporter permease [Prevotella sp.]
MTRKERQELFAQANRFFVDIAKLVFAGVILAGILKQDVDFWLLISGGVIVMMIMLYAAYLMFRNSKK